LILLDCEVTHYGVCDEYSNKQRPESRRNIQHPVPPPSFLRSFPLLSYRLYDGFAQVAVNVGWTELSDPIVLNSGLQQADSRDGNVSDRHATYSAGETDEQGQSRGDTDHHEHPQMEAQPIPGPISLADSVGQSGEENNLGSHQAMDFLQINRVKR
jgi:hypothetical protein